MPEIPRMLPSRRLFARIDKFECTCPHCNRMIVAGLDKAFLPSRGVDISRARARAKERPRSAAVKKLLWNPWSQRLRCPWCDHVYTVGVLLYPVQPRGRGVTEPAPDVVPTPAEVAEMRRLAGGWFVPRIQRKGEHANQLVDAPCCCPIGKTDPACLIHGDGAQDWGEEGGTGDIPWPLPAEGEGGESDEGEGE